MRLQSDDSLAHIDFGRDRASRAISHRPATDSRVVRQLEDYFRGRLTEFDVVYRFQGTPFQVAVWREIARIPYGETITYGDIAAAIGKPGASRAVGAACGQNPFSIVVPCHRVVGQGGAITGYGGGVWRKRWLLDFERGQPGLTFQPPVTGRSRGGL